MTQQTHLQSPNFANDTVIEMSLWSVKHTHSKSVPHENSQKTQPEQLLSQHESSELQFLPNSCICLVPDDGNVVGKTQKGILHGPLNRKGPGNERPHVCGNPA